ncbi:MAG: outer membrane beta-barrel protein [Bacteroidales bacterium]|nr:outer membrane beta-barrel protein [Bacteroidales bacterium]
MKLYYDGDTLVYNADAFLLPEGSMLDDLIRKLDGVSINRAGEIFCNGRKVESLMLEGRKLFNGNPRLLLENLGAYTVKKIKVYDFTSKEEEVKGYSVIGQKPMVMDVVLKPEYSIGKWVNLDAGYGTSNRYLGRLFALGFTKTSAISAFTNVNNLSTESNTEKNDYWTPGMAGRSDSRYISGGLSYEHETKRVNFRGSAAVNTDREINKSGSESATYLSGGDRFGSSYSNNIARSLKVSTDHSLDWKFSKATLRLTPSFSYSRDRSDGSSVSATFSEDFGTVSAEEIEALYSGDYDRLVRSAINRSTRRNESDATKYYGNLGARSLVRLPDLGNGVYENLTFTVGGNYSNSRRESFSRYMVNYAQDPEPGYDVYSMTRVRPSWSGNANGSVRYEVNIKGDHTVSLSYSYSHHHDVNTSDRYLLSNLDNASLRSLTFGEVPVDVDLSALLDPDNSRKTRYMTNSHRLNGWVNLNWGRTGSRFTDELKVILRPGIEILNRHYDYMRPNYDTTVVSHTAMPNVEANLELSRAKEASTEALERRKDVVMNSNAERVYKLSVNWKSSPSLFSMGNLINVYNTTDPLNIFRGNPNLRNGYQHSASLSFNVKQQVPMIHSHTLALGYRFATDMISRGMNYDPQTGVTTTSMYNVNGYYSCNISYNGYGPIFRRGNRRLGYNLGVNCWMDRNPVMVGFGADDGTIIPVKQYNFNRNINPSVDLNYSFGRRGHTVSAGWNGSFGHFSSDSEYYLPMKITGMNYRLSLSLRLPYDIGLSSNATLFTRRGYDDPALNSNEVVWNASASWTWKKQRLTFILDAYDMLGQIKVISAYSNALGRTETWKNTLPRYVLLRLRYHLDVSPK